MSNSNAHASVAKRPYKLGKRADQQAQTRRRIVEAAVDLHSSVGPAQTTVAQIAERAGVQRHTYYAHFPTEWDLLQACSGFALERDPLPEAEAFALLPAGAGRVSAGLSRFYAWFARNEQMAACVLRDADHHQLTRDIVHLRMAPAFVAANEILGEGLGPRSRAVLALALDFASWRNLSQTCSPAEAASLMSEAILAVGD
jgi:AcrR family transcriptional regulator